MALTVFPVLIQTVSLLLNKGASLNVCDKKERQPLHWAAFLGEKMHGKRRSWVTRIPGAGGVLPSERHSANPA